MSHPGGAECIQVSWLVDIINGQNYDPRASEATATQDDIDITINNSNINNTTATNNNISTGLSQGTDYSQASSFGSSQLLLDNSQQQQHQPPPHPQHKGHNSDPLLLSSTAFAKGGVKRSRPIFGLQDPLHERKEGERKVAVSTPAERNNNDTNDTNASISSKMLKASQPPRNDFKNKSNNKENLNTTTITTTITSPTPSSSCSSSSSTNTNTPRPTTSRTSSSSSSRSILKHSFPTPGTATRPRSSMRGGTNKTSWASCANKKAKI